MVEKFIGSRWCVRYYRGIRTVEVCEGEDIMLLVCYDRVCDAVNVYAAIKTVGDIKMLLGDV